MPGTVTLFNCQNETLGALSVGGFMGGSVAGWPFSGASMYQPQSIRLPRIRSGNDRTSAAFAYGDNPCQAQWDSVAARFTITVPAPGSPTPVSLDDDLIVYLTLNQAILLTARAFVIGNFPVQMTPG